jgi:LysM repeat protein
MRLGRDTVGHPLVLGVVLAFITAACIPFIGNDDEVDATPTPSPTLTIIRPSPTAIAEPTAPPAEESTYTVQAGDTLSTIADKLPGVTWQEIARANNIQDPYPVSIGQKLIIPPPPGQVPTPTPAGPTIVQTAQPKN